MSVDPDDPSTPASFGPASFGPATYGDGFADVYDDWYHDLGDADQTASVLHDLAGGGCALELGVGTGRLARPLAELGTAVVGLDASLAMLERAPSSAGMHRLAADAASLPLRDRSITLAFAAFNTFFSFTQPGAQAKCLAEARRVVCPGGWVVLECIVPTDPADAPRSTVEVSRLDTAQVVLLASRTGPDGVVRGQHIQIREDGIRLRPWEVHPLPPSRLDALATEVGLDLVERWGGWDRRPYDPDDTAAISLYRPSLPAGTGRSRPG